MAMNKTYRIGLRLLIVLITAGVFGFYLSRHPDLLHELSNTSPGVLIELFGIYLLWFCALALTVDATLRICACPLGLRENILLNAYSTLVNFFVPGQGGVAVRGLYLKKRHQLLVRHYVMATLVYYASYAIVSAFLLLVFVRPWWQTGIGVLVVLLGSLGIVKVYGLRTDGMFARLVINASTLGYLALATSVQAIVQIAVYGTELRAVDQGITLSQVVTYTGAANFSLFVALTPGAIGIRESFLLFTEHLHHVSTLSIVAASVIDRAVFMMLLGTLFLLTLVFHARKSFGTD